MENTMTHNGLVAALMALGGAAALGPAAAPIRAAEKHPINAPASLEEYSSLAKLPDWSGVWTPDITDQEAQERSTHPPPGTAVAAKQIKKMYADEEAGRPFEIIDHCFPTGMPSWMLITHNAFEV